MCVEPKGTIIYAHTGLPEWPNWAKNSQKWAKMDNWCHFIHIWPLLYSWLIFGCFWTNLAVLVALHGLNWLYPLVLNTPIMHTSVPDTFRGKKEPKNYFFLGLNLVLAQNWLKNGQKWLKTATNQKSNLSSKTGLECHFQKWSNFLFWSLFCSWKQNFQGQK